MPAAHAFRRYVVAALSLAGAAGARASVEVWQFDALLDGRPIGEHRFALTHEPGEGPRLVSEARFDVTLLGLTVYRYRHRASERWSKDCLAAIEARTDDDGRETVVRGHAEPGRFVIDADGGGGPAGAVAAPCLMSFAYWHPALASQRQLLDPGTGRVETVVVVPLPETRIDVARQSTPVRGVRIGGLARPIDVWYAGDRWVGLDTTVQGGRRLSYRLR